MDKEKEEEILKRLDRMERAWKAFSDRMEKMKKLGFPHIGKLADEVKKELDT